MFRGRIKKVTVRSTTFDFSEEQMITFYQKIKSGKTYEEALAQILGCSPRQDPSRFLTRKLTPLELERLIYELKKNNPYR